MTDRPLLARYADAADPAAMAELVRRHGPMVLNAARRLAPAEADDVGQAVFILLARRCGELRHRDSVTGWLYEATRLCAKDARRAAARRRRHLRRLQEMSMPIPPSVHAGVEWAAELDSALGRLSEADRHVVLLRYFEGLSVAEAADRLGLSPAAVTKRAGRAIERLRGIFRARGHAVPAEQLAGGLVGHALPLSAGELVHLSSPASGGGAATIADHAGRSFVLAKIKTTSVVAAVVLGPVAIAAVLALVVQSPALTLPTKPSAVIPAAVAPVVTAAPDSFEAAEQTADAFLNAVRDNDLATARGCLPDNMSAEAAAATVEALRRPYVDDPQRLTERVGTMRNQDMNGRPLMVQTESTTPIEASVERLTLRLSPRPGGGGWVVAECGMKDGLTSPPPAVDDVPRVAAAEKAVAQKALKAWNTWFESARPFSTSTPTVNDGPKVREAFVRLRGGLGPMLDALKETPFEKPADTQKRAEAAIDAMIDMLDKQGIAAFLKVDGRVQTRDSELLSDLWGLGPKIAERADADVDDKTASPRPPVIAPDRTLTVGDKTVTLPGPQPVPAWLRSGAAWKRWQRTKDVRTFTTYDDAGNRYVVAVNGFVNNKPGGPSVESIGAVRRYRPDGTLAAMTEYTFGAGEREWMTLDPSGKRIECQVRLENHSDASEPEAVDRVRWYEPDGTGRSLDFDSRRRPREVLIDPIGRELKTVTPRY